MWKAFKTTAAIVLAIFAVPALLLAAVMAVYLATHPAGAASVVVADCGSSSGHAFYLPGPLVPDDEAGWIEDHVGGWFKLVMFGPEDAPEFDILYKGAGANGGSYTVDGYHVFLVNDAPQVIALAVLPNGGAETFLFDFDAGLLVWSRTSAGTQPITKGSIMVAECVFPLAP